VKALETIFLGVIQGLTEFLPVSSSGHLVVFQNLIGLKEPELLLDCSLHLGTLLAVCIYFRSDVGLMVKEIWQLLKQTMKILRGSGRSDPDVSSRQQYDYLVWWVIIGSVPTGIIGLVFREPLENLFGSVSTVGVMLIVTGIIVGLTRLMPEGYGTRARIGFMVALAVGTAQGLAIIPGISRSGATIVCGLLFGLDRELAGRFSFLLAIPAIIAALAVQINVEALARVGFVPLLFGFLSSALVGFVALKLLMGMVKKGHLYYFAPYCWAVGLLILVLA
jgi:undecaprenyl-diphosphatase